MSIVSKVFFRVLLTRLHAHPQHRVYLWLHNQPQENQCECPVPKPLKSKSATTLSREATKALTSVPPSLLTRGLTPKFSEESAKPPASRPN